jgi:hypothetical protein
MTLRSKIRSGRSPTEPGHGQRPALSAEQDDYASYLLRLTRSDRDDHAWRASLESTADGQRLEFGSVEALVVFLQEQYGQTKESQK